MAPKTAKKPADKVTEKNLALAKMCKVAAEDKKASDIVIIEVGSLTSYADYFVICSAPSERQVQAIVRNVETTLRNEGVRPIGIEGLDSSAWVLIDMGDVIFHCFTDSAREYYDLEGFWIDAPRVED